MTVCLIGYCKRISNLKIVEFFSKSFLPVLKQQKNNFYSYVQNNHHQNTSTNSHCIHSKCLCNAFYEFEKGYV